jgi:hypothetical protein
MARKWGLIALAPLAIWIAADFAIPRRSSLIHFDGRRVGRLETDMWRAYYGHNPLSLYAGLVRLLREQYHIAFWRACLGAYDAARAAVVFQRGHNRAEYELALPSLVRFYSMIRRDSDVAFPVEQAARLELEWWIIHRERAQHPPGDLERSLAALQAAIYQRPETIFAVHARARAEAMLLRDAGAEAGGVSDQDWNRIDGLLETSWVSLQTAVSQ